MANVLIACEESQAICNEFRKLGHNAFSCDIQKCSGGHPEYHFHQDVVGVIENRGGLLETKEEYYLPKGEGWDLLIAHPPCTYLSVSGAQWYYHPDDKDLPYEERREHPKYPGRRAQQQEAIDFFMLFTKTGIKHWAIENPICVMSSKYRKPNQIIQPYMFGDEATKTTCLWTENLPLLEPTDIVDKGEQVTFSSGKKMSKWYNDALAQAKTKEERQRLRSKTFIGVAKAIAKQWGDYVEQQKQTM